jgi:hypothetical protein
MDNPLKSRIGIARLIYHADFGNLPAHVRDTQRATHSSARSSRSLGDELAKLPTALDQAHSAPGLGNKPLIVVTAGRDAQPGWLPLQDELVGLSKNSLHRVLSNATHTSIIEGVDSINSSLAIRDVVEAVRGEGVRDCFGELRH